MSNTPKITVLMSVYNGKKFLREAIDSILNQTYKDFEFLIINDGSTDNSRNIILSYDDPRIRLLDNEKNIGMPKSLNKGIRLAQGKYIARMDADDISLPDRLKTQFKYMEAHLNIGLVGSYYHIIDEDNNKIDELAQDNLPVHHKDLVRKHFITHYVGHGTFFFRRYVVDVVGMYNEIFIYTEDADFIRRVSEIFEIANIPRVLYYWRKSKGNVTALKGDLMRRYISLAISKALLRKADRVSETVYKRGVLEKLLSGYYKIIARRLNGKYHLDELSGKG